MKKCAVFALSAGLVTFAACSKTPYQQRKATSPLLIPSKQVQSRFFACKALLGSEWVGVGEDFSTDDEKIIIMARPDKTSLDSWLILEILSPENRIIETEAFEYDALRDIGVYFDPVQLVEKGGAGRYEARIYSDARPIGRVQFLVEDRREEGATEAAMAPVLDEVEWDVPTE